MLRYNRESITSYKEFEIDSFDESDTLEGELDLTDDLMALLIAIELDVTIATASEPLHHGPAAIIDDINLKIDGSDQRISCSGYEAVQQTVMYTGEPPINMQVGAVGANQKLLLGLLIPAQIVKERGKKVKLKIKTLTELRLDDTAGNITINDATTITEVGGIFGKIRDETWIIDGSETFGTARKEVKISGEGKFIEQVGLIPDPEVAAAVYDVVDRVQAMVGKRVLYEGNKTALAVYGALTGGRYIAQDEYLGAVVYNTFQDDFISRGLMLPLPTTKLDADLLLRITRTTSDNVFWSACQSMPIEGRGEAPLDQKAEPTSSKTPV